MTRMTATFLEVKGPICDALVRLCGDRVVEAERIVGSMAGWSLGEVRQFCRRAGWTCDEVGPREMSGPTRRLPGD